MRRLYQAQRTRLIFYELRPTFPGISGEVITAYSDEFNQPVIVVDGMTDMVAQLAKFSDTINNKAWSQEPVPIRIYAGQRSSTSGHQRFPPQMLPAGARIVGDYKNLTFGLNAAITGIGRHIFTCYYIAAQTAPATAQELEALKAAEEAIKNGTKPDNTTLNAALNVDGVAGNSIKGKTKPTDRALLITGLTCNMPATGNARISISDSTSNQAWMKDLVTWWGVAGETLNGGAPIHWLAKPYYLPAGAILSIDGENAVAADGAPIGAGLYQFGFVCETP
jgi:hypothetical protein